MISYTVQYTVKVELHIYVQCQLATACFFFLCFSAVQMLCLAFYLPFLIGDVIEEHDRKWKCFILLLKITSICSAYEIEKEHIPVLRLLIAEHHTLFREVYPDASIIPKMHYMVHYPSQILR